MKILLWPFIILSGLGLILSLIVHIVSWLGVRIPFDHLVWHLHSGIFVVWFPAVLVVARLTKDYKHKDFWRAAFRGCPTWMRRMAYGFFAYAIANFILFMLTNTATDRSKGTPPSVFRGFSGHWMAFYSISLAVLYSATKAGDTQRRCPLGHAVSVSARYCEECGAPMPPP